MKVRMLIGISGGRGDGTPWPHPGGELVVSDEEGAALCAGRMAVPVAEEDPAELREAESPAEAPEGPGGAKPAVNASKAEWVAYAAAQGLTADEAGSMTKADLIAALGG